MGSGKKSSKARLISHHIYIHNRKKLQESVAYDIRMREKLKNYQPDDPQKFKLGEEWFNNGFALDEASDELKKNTHFVKGFERAKRIADIEKELYNLGVQYFNDGLSLELIPKMYRHNASVLKGYEEAKNNAKVKTLVAKEII